MTLLLTYEEMQDAIDDYGIENIVAWDLMEDGITPILSDEFLQKVDLCHGSQQYWN